MSLRLAFLAVPAVAATGCICTADDGSSDASTGLDAASDAAAEGPRDAGSDAPPIDWPDASLEIWFCRFPGPCPPERPFCCPKLEGPDECDTTNLFDCLEWPEDGTALRVSCGDPGAQCAADRPFCCEYAGEAVCAARELEGWSCDLDG